MGGCDGMRREEEAKRKGRAGRRTKNLSRWEMIVSGPRPPSTLPPSPRLVPLPGTAKNIQNLFDARRNIAARPKKYDEESEQQIGILDPEGVCYSDEGG